MDRKRNNSSTKLAELQSQLAEEIGAGLSTCLDNLDLAMRGGADDLALLRRVKGELITTRNLATLLANNLKPEPQAIKREAPEASNITTLRRAAE